MDNEMITRVVKALDDAWPENHKDAALKVIKAMREPTNKMVDEGGYTPSYHDGMIMDETAKMCWQTMIDSILND